MIKLGEFQRPAEGPLAEKILDLVSSCWKTQAVYVAAELKIADFLSDRPQSSEELAVVTQANPAALRQLLRALTTLEICIERPDGLFELGPLGKLLVSNSADSLRAWTIWFGAQLWPVWGQLLYSVRTGQSARKLLLGTDGFAHLERDPAIAESFHQAAAELSRLTAAGLFKAYEFSRFSVIVDVGGGNGALLARILQATSARGVLVDLPYAISAGYDRFQELGLASRCECVAANFFDAVPAGGDLYILKSVIHDWNDESSRKILENCRKSIGGGRLLLVEQMLPDRLTNSPAHQASVFSDLNMLAAHAARERTEGELRALLRIAGFCVTRVVPAEYGFTLIEAIAQSDSNPSTPQDDPSHHRALRSF